MKKKGLLVIMILFAVLLCGLAGAEGQTNPRWKHVQETIQWRNRRQGLFLAGGQTLTVTCNRVPTLNTPGKFTVTVNNDDGSEWLFEYAICDNKRDLYGYVYFGTATASKVFEGFDFYTAGDYTLYVYLYRANDPSTNVATGIYTFTVEALSGYQTLEEKAQAIVNECSVSGNDWQTALNLHDWLTMHTYYDENYEYYGADVLFRGKGVCDSYSKAYKLLCNTAGITAERITSNAQNHAWNAIKLSNEWYQVDVTWDDPSGGTAAISGNEHYAYYCLSDDAIFLDHTRYDVSFNPGCTSMAMNYYIRKNCWQDFGKYSPYGDTVMEYFQNELSQGNASPSFSLDNWSYYWPGGNSGYGMRAVEYIIYVTGMQQADWILDEEPLKANIELHYSDRYVSLDARWDVAETGTLTLPKGIKTIDENTFEKTKATTVIIPTGCTSIKAGAFRNSGVRTVYVPETVTTAADDAFDGCQRIIFILDAAESDFADYAKQKGHLVVEP